MAKTKIICTLGPASNSETVIRKLTLLGMDVVRCNFSHGTHKTHSSAVKIVRTVNNKYRRHIRILGDLAGHRVRIGRLWKNKPIYLKKRKIIYLSQRNIIDKDNIIPFDYSGNLKVFKKDHLIFIDDGRICLKVKGVEKYRLKTEVVVGGLLESKKGINVPEAKLEFPKISKKDKKDINFIVEQKFDFIAQSFVRTKKDVLEVRKIIANRLPDCKIISKIENSEGIKNIDEILDVSDGIMIARGDMGISVPIYKIPIIQKQIIKKCNKRKKFVITATQMLEHMVENRIPTRAEVTDIANAILDGTDFVMLSGETAKGKYPVLAAGIMSKIVNFTEGSSLYKKIRT